MFPISSFSSSPRIAHGRLLGQGGHIVGSLNVPSDEFKHKCVELVQGLKDKRFVVFHCALSQGESCFIIKRDCKGKCLAILIECHILSVRGPKCAKYYNQQRDPSLTDTFQQVFVLRNGFAGWQAKYKMDTRLVENYDPVRWDDDFIA